MTSSPIECRRFVPDRFRPRHNLATTSKTARLKPVGHCVGQALHLLCRNHVVDGGHSRAATVFACVSRHRRRRWHFGARQPTPTRCAGRRSSRSARTATAMPERCVANFGFWANSSPSMFSRGLPLCHFFPMLNVHFQMKLTLSLTALALALVIVRATQPGKITLTAHSDGLNDATVKISAQP